MLFEIINPSDKCTVVADDLEVAAFVVVALGRGKYSLKGLDTDLEVPFFLFGGHDEWFTEKFDRNLEQSIQYTLQEKRQKVIEAFDSVLMGGVKAREDYDKAMSLIDCPVKQVEWRDHFKDQHRSSMNDICKYAWSVADRYRKPAVTEQSE